ncbi:hypothetical protein BKA64DRAFT_295535 [Cadophora sp. MPI-SDFR-AT-0126]|nr:hypothetical protein BKA64DRAFT_295535 [Leotiomycetes sp. MPI-SDFR-AT-0126]
MQITLTIVHCEIAQLQKRAGISTEQPGATQYHGKCVIRPSGNLMIDSWHMRCQRVKDDCKHPKGSNNDFYGLGQLSSARTCSYLDVKSGTGNPVDITKFEYPAHFPILSRVATSFSTASRPALHLQLSREQTAPSSVPLVVCSNPSPDCIRAARLPPLDNREYSYGHACEVSSLMERRVEAKISERRFESRYIPSIVADTFSPIFQRLSSTAVPRNCTIVDCKC